MNYLILFVLLAGCGYANFGEFKIDNELKPYYAKYLYEASLRNRDLKPKYLIVKFEDSIEGRILGYCEIQVEQDNLLKSTPIVVIDRIKWNNADELDRTTLMFHELHHCIGGFSGHDDSVDEDGYPKSLMNTFSVSEAYPIHTKNNWTKYLDELFSK